MMLVLQSNMSCLASGDTLLLAKKEQLAVYSMEKQKVHLQRANKTA